MPKMDFPSIPPDPNPVTLSSLSPVPPPGPPGAAPMLTLFVGVMLVGLIEFVTARPASGCVCVTASGSLAFFFGSAGIAASAWGEGRRFASNAPDCADLRIFFCGAFFPGVLRTGHGVSHMCEVGSGERVGLGA